MTNASAPLLGSRGKDNKVIDLTPIGRTTVPPGGRQQKERRVVVTKATKTAKPTAASAGAVVGKQKARKMERGKEETAKAPNAWTHLCG